MAARYLLGIDVGGGGGRSLLLELGRGAVTTASRAWAHRAAPGTHGMGVDLDLDALWAALGEATREVVARAGAAPDAIVGVAATGMRFATVVLDAAGDVLFAAPNRDGRAAGEAFGMAADGEALYAATGLWPSPIAPAARLRWLAANAPERFARAARVLALDEWVALRLCGEVASSPSQAAGTLLFDLASGAWNADRCAQLGIPEALLPPIAPSGRRLGTLRPDAAAHLGLRPATPVAVGGADTQCALLGAGCVEPGDTALVAGTTGPVQRVCDAAVVDAEGRTWTGMHVVPDRTVVESNAGPTGESVDWLAAVLYPETRAASARLLAEAAATEPGAGGLLSTFGAQVMHARDASVPTGRLTLSMLAAPDAAQRRPLLARAVAEGIAYALRANLEQVRDVGGAEVAPVHLTGGMSRSDGFAALLADVLARPVSVTATHAASGLGAALCAGVAAGVWSDLAEAARSATRARLDASPHADRSAAYEERYQGWRRLLDAETEPRGVAAGLMLPAVLQARAASEPAGVDAPRPRILVTADLDPASHAALAALGEVEYAPFREKMRLLTGPGLVEALAGFDVFVTEIDVVDADALAALPALRVVAACRGDAVNVDVEAATALGVPVLFAPGRNAAAVADLTLAFLLMLARKLRPADAFLREPGGRAGDMGRMGRAFGTYRGDELGGLTVGLVGLGAVGRGVAQRLAPFGARVLVFDPHVGHEAIARAGGEPAHLDTLLAESDLVSLHAAVSDETRGLIGVRELARMQPGAGLVNTARAALVDEAALTQALASGALGGAALDVFSEEPPASDHPLLALPNVIATPHVGGNTRQIGGHQGALVAADLGRLLRGERAQHVLNPAALEGFEWAKPRPTPSAEQLAALRGRNAPAVSDLQRDGGGGGAAPVAAARAAAPAPVAASADPAVIPGMQAVLAAFTSGIAADPALAAFAADKDVTLAFALPDAGLDFHFRLRDGAVDAALGVPEGEPEVQLRMRADILDGMFTGRVNAMQAAMNGQLAFAGDTAKAMTLQHIQDDLSRLYRAAVAQVGPPGDLAALPDPNAGAAAARAPVHAGDEREQLVAVVNELYAQELITATGGNVSARREDAPEELWITPSQLFKGDLRSEILVRLDTGGHALDAGAASPSSERMIHCAIYRARPDARAVVHAHAPHATILANTGLPFLPISTEAAFFGNIPRVPFIMPGTDALAAAVGEAIRESWAVLLVNHGLIVAGRSLRRAADMVEIIERSAEVILGCYAVGREPPVLPDDIVATLREMGDLVA